MAKGSLRWVEALLVGKPAGLSGVVSVACGWREDAPARVTCARSGEAHPVAAGGRRRGGWSGTMRVLR